LVSFVSRPLEVLAFELGEQLGDATHGSATPLAPG
jgi:hypothetical protein